MWTLSALLNKPSNKIFEVGMTPKMAMRLLAISPVGRLPDPTMVNNFKKAIKNRVWEDLPEHVRLVALRRITGEIMDGRMKLIAISESDIDEVKVLIILCDDDIFTPKSTN